MSDLRIVTIRKSVSVDPSKILLPLLFINPALGYSVDSIIRYIHSSPDVVLKLNLFPHRIKEYYWIQEGIPGQQPWFALGCLEENLYFFYKAFTHSTFDKNGHMDLWVSHSFSDLIQYAMDKFTYNTYIQYTSDELSSDS
jgi:hypothetical protein